MKRLLVPGLILLLVPACQLPPERAAGTPLPALPENGPALPYSQLLGRARTQALQATEAMYVDRWQDLVDVASGLEQTAQYLQKADDVPATLKDILPVASAELVKEARNLRTAAQARDLKTTNETLQRINLKIREIRPST